MTFYQVNSCIKDRVKFLSEEDEILEKIPFGSRLVARPRGTALDYIYNYSDMDFEEYTMNTYNDYIIFDIHEDNIKEWLETYDKDYIFFMEPYDGVNSWDGEICDLTNSTFYFFMNQKSDSVKDESSETMDPERLKNLSGDIYFISKYIKSEYWDKDFSVFHNLVKEDVVFIFYFVQSSLWSGKMSDFSSKIRNNINFARFVITLSTWDGNIRDFCKKVRADKILWKIYVTSGHWNGVTKMIPKSILEDDFCRKLMRLDVWDGDFRQFPKSIFEDFFSVAKIVRSPYWNVSCYSLIPKYINNPYICVEIINNPTWNGDHKHFTDDLMNNELIISEILKSGKWKSGDKRLKKRLNKLNLYKEKVINVIKEEPLVEDESMFDYFKKDKQISIELIDSYNWNGRCFFSGGLMNDVDFCFKIIEKDNWYLCSNFFGTKPLNDIDFILSLMEPRIWERDRSFTQQHVTKLIKSSKIILPCLNHCSKVKQIYKNFMKYIKESDYWCDENKKYLILDML